MNYKQKLSLQITSVIFLFFIIFGIIFLFIFSDSLSIKDLLFKLFDQKIIFGRSVEYFYLYLFFKSIFMLFGIYFISNYSIGKYLKHLELYNEKLKDYNHYLAHELKTPISIVNSNLDVLKYGLDEDRINNSKSELKNMTNIINGLLNFSETVQIINKSDINLENFINRTTYFLQKENNIHINNNEFNKSIHTDEVLFERVIKNLVENAIKYSIDGKIIITITQDKIIFENNIYKTLNNIEIEKISQKFYSGSYTNTSGNGIGLSMISEITKVLGYELNIFSNDCKFIVEINM